MRVIYGQGAQTLRLIPVDRHGRPTRVSSANYTIVNLDKAPSASDRTVQAATAASLDAASTTASAAAGAGQSSPRQLTVVSTTGFSEGRQYLLTGLDGQREVITVQGVQSATVLHSLHSLQATYASGSTLQGIELSGTFPLSEADDEDNVKNGYRYQVTWDYTLHGQECYVPQLVRLTRYDEEPWIVDADLIRLIPTLPDQVRGRVKLSDCIAEGTRDLLAELEGSGFDPGELRLSAVAQRAVTFRAAAYAHRLAKSEIDDARADLWDQRYERMLHNLLEQRSNAQVARVDKRDEITDATISGYFKRP